MSNMCAEIVIDEVKLENALFVSSRKFVVNRAEICKRSQQYNIIPIDNDRPHFRDGRIRFVIGFT